MTGRRPGRGAPGDPWRGGRPESASSERRPVYRPDSPASGAELEELPAQPVLGRASSRLGLGGALAIVAIVALVAAGFGLLGGRPQPTQAPTAGATVSPTPSLPPPLHTPIVVVPEGPLVTPWTECGPAPASPPSFLLEADGTRVPGILLEVFGPDGLPVPQPTIGGDPSPLPPIAIPPELAAEIWIDDGACAVAWTIEVGEDGVLEDVDNDARDPAVASQNRFRLLLVELEGHAMDLIGTFVFPELSVRVRWPIEIGLVQRPSPALADDRGRDIPLTPGCDIVQTLANGWTEQPVLCEYSVPGPLDSPKRVGAGDELTFAVEGWRLDGITVSCGQLSGTLYVAAPESTCLDSGEPGTEPFTFEVVREPGEWVYAVSMCGSPAGAIGLNHACGTWYAAVQVED